MPLLVDEPASPVMEAEFASDPNIIAWWATSVECVSAICRLEREKALSPHDAVDSLDNLDALKNSWHEVQPVERVRSTARRLLRLHPLRAADALQLAAALAAAEDRPESLTIVSLDDRLNAAAEREGLKILRRPSPS